MDVLLVILFIANLSLGILVFSKAKDKSIKLLFLTIALGVALWNIATFLFWHTPNPLFWGRVMFIGPIVMGSTFLHLCLLFPPQQLPLRSPTKVLMYIPLVGFLFLVPTDIIVKEIIFPSREVIYGIGNALFGLYFFLFVVAGFFILLKKYKSSEGVVKLQLKYLLLGTIIATIIGVTTNLFLPLLGTSRFNRLGPAYTFIFVLFMAYAILRYKLFDIEVIVKKTLVYAGLFTFAFGVIVGIAMITQELLPQFFAINRFISLAISAVIIVFSLRPLENFLTNATNRYLFQKKYDPRKILKDFADEVLTILNLDRVCKVTIDTLVKNLYLTNCAVLLLSRDESGYEIYDSFGIQDEDAYLVNEDSIIRRLKVTQAPILYQSYDSSLQASDDIKKNMDKIKSAFCMPLIIHNELVGILSLGAKKSDQAYTDDDVDILTTLDKALSIAISNAKLFTQAAQYEKLAAIGTLASSVNHEVCNPLNNISIRMQVFSENLRRGLYKDKSTNELLKEAEKIMDHSIGQIERVAAITSKLSSFAKPSKAAAAKPVDITESVNDALGVVGHELELNKIKLEKNIPADLLKIMADEDQMQQIFFNLIRNAAQAVEENGTITITAKEDNNRIKVEVADTGCGIPEDKLNKIFEPFYTTKDKVKGSGFGLAIVRELIWRNKGNISVKSKQGEGTTFYLEFPKA